MNMTSDYKRRVHIEGQPNNPSGHVLTIRDADTGEMITNVKSGIAYFDAAQLNRVELTYYEKDEQNRYILQDGDPVTHTTTLEHEDVSLNITAFETIPTPEEAPHE